MPRKAVEPSPRWQRLPDERPQALMASAMKLLKRRGYRQVGLAEIARDAGVSKATIYYYFTDKDDLLTRAVADRMAAHSATLERDSAAAGGSAEARLRLFLQRFFRMALSPQTGLWQRLLMSELVTDAPHVFAAWARGLVERWRLVEALIHDGQAAGEFRPDLDGQAAARLVLSALSHQALFHVHFGVRRFAPYPTRRLGDEMINQFVSGLRVQASRSR
jgi:AcrR family transcriptional regulator